MSAQPNTEPVTEDPAHGRIGFADLLGALEPQQFVDRVWEQRFQHVRGTLDGRTHELLTLDELEWLMAGAPAGPDTWIMVVDGLARPLTTRREGALPVADLRRAYAAGRSLLVLDVQRRVQPIARLCRSTERALLRAGLVLARGVSGNVYLTPPGASGLDAHHDDTCVLIVQLVGRKHWTLYAPLEPLPTRRCDRPLPADRLTAPIAELTLEAGDVLYVPRGFPHRAHTDASAPSMHLTISLPTLTWGQLVAALLDDQEGFRRSVRRRDGASCAADVTDLLGSADITDVADRADRAIDGRVDALAAEFGPADTGRLELLHHTGNIDRSTALRRRDDALCSSAREDNQAVLRFPGVTLRLPAVMAPVFDHIAGAACIRAADLPAVAAHWDPLELVQLLVREGLLEPVSAPLAPADSPDQEHLS